ncbi:AAA family ATPase [Nonomuraea fuscirosea]|uniref:ATP-binding protein n=1 Tax=Nonomuraea fuscirosea TaxID=1291556 RepID=UPI002DDB3B8A|nr:AAA family ATPase [Nonomuraea fuscirosea]WSA48347.1 AAA family ATPase [Nonomuraea fuscirosea]
MAGESLRLEILGPPRIWRDGVERDPGPRQQAYLLAVLLARAGQPVSTADLIDLIWEDDVPASAINLIHKYMGALRRVLEPGLPARDTGAYLHRRGNSYLCTAGPGTLDLIAFRELVATARTERPEEALGHYVAALGHWNGPAGSGLSHRTAGIPIFAALDAEVFDVCVTAAGLAVELGRPERVLPALQLAASIAPLHEPVQASLVTALDAAGHRAEALAVFRTVRTRLDEELGIAPGQALQAAYAQVLKQTVALPGGASRDEPPTTGGLVGRADELATLRRTLGPALAGGSGIGVVEGEPGVGKTRLLEEIAAEADRRGALVVWGRCLDGDGTPSMWPWVQVIGALLDNLAAPERAKWHAGELGRLVEAPDDADAVPMIPDSGSRFRLFEQVVTVISESSARRPVLLVLDDLQWADIASLQLFSHVAARLPAGTAVIGALRDRAPAPGSELSRALAAVSRVSGHRRVRLGPLGPDEAIELIRLETGLNPDPDAARGIHARTAGNPFFIRELSRQLAGDGALTDATGAVPATVRDIVIDRMSGLDADARDLLRTAALMGRDIDLGLLARAAHLTAESCLERLESVAALGMIESTPENPYSLRFTHDLVRESVVGTTSTPRTSQLHLRISDALEIAAAGGESTAERLAHHLWAAGPLADPARTATALVRAGRSAAGKSALEAAERHLLSAAQVARTAGLAELELSALSQLTAVLGMRSMYGFSSFAQLERAERLARELGREVEAASFLYSRWAAHAQAIELDRSGPLARRLLDAGEASADPFVSTSGLQAWGIYQWHLGDIGEAYRYLSRSKDVLLDLAQRDEDPVRHDLLLIMIGLLAEVTALHGDLGAAREMLGMLDRSTGDDPYVRTIWATFAARTASLTGDPVEALRVTELGIAADPGLSFAYLGTYQRLARCWALTMTGDDPAGATAQAERIIAKDLLDPPRSCVATWFGLLGEMRLMSGDTVGAAAALDRADFCLDAYGQRYPEGLVLLQRARLLQARGEPEAAVRRAGEQARELSIARGAHLFARRAETFLAGLG